MTEVELDWAATKIQEIGLDEFFETYAWVRNRDRIVVWREPAMKLRDKEDEE